MIYDVSKLNASKIVIGRRGENLATTIEIDVSAWLAEYPSASLRVVVMRPGDTAPYVASTSVKNGVLSWPVTNVDTENAGKGKIEVRASFGAVLKKSVIATIEIEPCILCDENAEPPELDPAIVDQVIAAAERAEAAAKQATSHTHARLTNTTSPTSVSVVGEFDDLSDLIGWQVYGKYSATDDTTVGISLRVNKDTGVPAMKTYSKSGTQFPILYTSLNKPSPATLGAAEASHTHNYAGSSSAGGAATSANKLNTNAGDTNTPVYFANGVPVACTGHKRVTLWSGTAANGASITFSESLNNFSQIACLISNVPSDVVACKNGSTVAMFMRMAYNNNNQTIYSARLDIASDGLSATVTNPCYVIHTSGSSHSSSATSSVTAVYGWR